MFFFSTEKNHNFIYIQNYIYQMNHYHLLISAHLLNSSAQKMLLQKIIIVLENQIISIQKVIQIVQLHSSKDACCKINMKVACHQLDLHISTKIHK